MTFQFKPLRRIADQADYSLYRAAVEYDLIEPIVIESREDLRSEGQWRDRLEPYHHQVTNLITFCRRLPVTLLADDVGLGKTISAGLVASELIARGRLSKVLVVCPKLLIPQWKEELEVKFGIPGVGAVGKDLVEAKPPGEIGAVITTYDSARLYLDLIAKAGFEMLVLDEAHKLRNLYGTDRTPQRAIRFRQALADRLFKYVLMLTATPIHNRLWDLYSLVDLLTVARGHENPFGTEGMFVRNFIADGRTKARKLRPEKQNEFRSIVYGYMSRFRRADAKLSFPDRKVQLHKVDPTSEELEIIDIIAKPIQKLNRLAQISILQATVSSPHALLAQLENMARNETAPTSLAEQVRAVVHRMRTTAKLQGLGALIDQLKAENPDRWRMVVFTTRRETQTTIEALLGEKGIPCGLINGDSGQRNQQTISRFWKDPPEIHVIVSTEAGSEGVNLQVANVLVNFDLPWNPMVVEQRIGRVQRLASQHASVCIFNVILRDTFEEHIVGRLMEKLQMASHAVGDVEALLEGAGLNEDEEDSKGFEEKIRELIVASLAGKDVEAATRMAEKNILEAKEELKHEEDNINAMLGGMNGALDSGPRSPKLPPLSRSMEPRNFVLSALESLGARLSPDPSGTYICDLDGQREVIRFEDGQVSSEGSATLYKPGTPAFERLVARVAGAGRHQVEDVDQTAAPRVEEVVRGWVDGFGGTFQGSRVEETWRCFDGTALLRARVTVAHDSYERLVEVNCFSEAHRILERSSLPSLGDSLEDPSTVGVNIEQLKAKVLEDTGVAEFCRFYQERLVQELRAAGQDARKRKKLEDDFTPRVGVVLIGLGGMSHRQNRLRVSYSLGSEDVYESFLTLRPSTSEIWSQPEMDTCASTGKRAPRECLGRCEISGKAVLRHLLVRSEASGRRALPEHAAVCGLSGKRVLADEVEKSAVTGRSVISSLLKTSALSGKRAEPEFFARCELTSAEILETELAVSQASGKRYRMDEQVHSAVSGKTGHRLEFIVCPETNQPLLPAEAERCEVTGKAVMPGLLETCEVTGKKVLPRELERCAASGKKALKKLFVSSSLSGALLLESEAVRSVAGKFCAPLEAKPCLWSGRRSHLDDLRVCDITGVAMHVEYIVGKGSNRFEVLVGLLEATRRKADDPGRWETVAACVAPLVGGGRCRVESAERSPDGRHLAVCVEVRTMLGWKVRHAGMLYSFEDQAVIGRIAMGKREKGVWQVC
ncbi:MAG: DEAD/DEAH box helicase [Elusimicrobia bacterium]|nr:DEAD/DEAH box helicase [Elusimicrobiota bacterium]